MTDKNINKRKLEINHLKDKMEQDYSMDDVGKLNEFKKRGGSNECDRSEIEKP